jgi:hypothetical protein
LLSFAFFASVLLCQSMGTSKCFALSCFALSNSIGKAGWQNLLSKPVVKSCWPNLLIKLP